MLSFVFFFVFLKRSLAYRLLYCPSFTDMLNTTGSEEATRWQVPLAPGPAVILRQSERWWGWSRSGSRLPSCPVRLLAGPEVGGSSRDAITTPLPAWCISVQPTLFSLLGFPRCQEDESMLLLAWSPCLRGVTELIQAGVFQREGKHRPSKSRIPAEHGSFSPHYIRY